MKKTMRSLLVVLSLVAVLSLMLAVGISAASAGNKFAAGNDVVSVTSSEDVFKNNSLITYDVSHVYSGFTLEDSTYRKVLAAYEIKLIGTDGHVYGTEGKLFNVKIILNDSLKSAEGLEVYSVSASGDAEKIEATLSNGYIEFTSDGLGIYALSVVADAPVPFVEPDYTWLGVLIGVAIALLVVGLVVLLVIRRIKKNAAENESAAAPVVEEAPAEEPAPVVEEAPVEEPTPVVEEALAEEPAPVVEEAPAEEPAPVVEEAPAEEPAPVVEEAPVEEPAPVVEEAPAEEPAKPVINLNFVDEAEAAQVASTDEEPVAVRFRTSFDSRYIQSGELQDYYTPIKNLLLSYKGVKARTSWNYESFNKGRLQCAKVNIKGNALLVYLPLDPANYSVTKYHFNDMSEKPKFAGLPMLMKVKSDRALKYTLELIEEVMRVLEIPLGKPVNEDYHMPYETTEQLAARGLVKVILPTGVSLEDNLSVVKTDVGALLAQEGGQDEAKVELLEEVVKAPAVEEEPVAEPVPVVEEAPAEKPVVVEAVAEEPAPVAAEEPVVEEEPVHELPPVVEEENVVHVDAVHADALLTNEEAEEVIEHVHTGKSGGKGKLAVVNLDSICQSFNDGDVVDLAALKAKRLVPSSAGSVKVLARGVMTKALTVIADKYSLSAVKMIYLAGGHAEIDE